MVDNPTRLLAVFTNAIRSPFARRAILIILLLVTGVLFLQINFSDGLITRLRTSADRQDDVPGITKAFVVSSMKKGNTKWIDELFPDWTIYKYVTDDPDAKYTVPKNKGNEAMAYLTYVIDNYHSLTNIPVFIHGERYQWHNDDPLYDGYEMLSHLQIPYLLSNGYTNIRCVWTLGCPAELSNLSNAPPSQEALADPKADENTQLHFPAAFKELFPGVKLPSTVGVPCCAQFAVSSTKIRSRPLEDYIRYREWLIKTDLKDHVSGRVLEYSWHIIFGHEAVHCPNAQECYCKVFGYCDLECGKDKESSCGERWPFPPYASLPKGWPVVGWDGKERTKEELEEMRLVNVTSHPVVIP